MNIYKMIYKSMIKTRPIRYSYEMNQMIEIMKDNLDYDQNKLFKEFLDKINQEQYEINYKWYVRGIANTKQFILK
ncbi:MAG: hypothetical protein N2749_01255 [Clostridia bacterium]|nr:hypothetical protein [Clostridia bacterium]